MALTRVVTRYVGSGIKGVGSGIRRVGSRMGSGSAVSYRDQDQAVPHWWDQGRKLVTLLESRNRNLRTKMGSAMKKHTSLPSCLTETAS